MLLLLWRIFQLHRLARKELDVATNITIQIRRGSYTLAYIRWALTIIFSYSRGLAKAIGVGWTLALMF